MKASLDGEVIVELEPVFLVTSTAELKRNWPSNGPIPASFVDGQVGLSIRYEQQYGHCLAVE